MKILKAILFTFASFFSFSQIISYSTNDTIVYDIINSPLGTSKFIDINQDGSENLAAYLSGANGDKYMFFNGFSDSAIVLNEPINGPNWSTQFASDMTDNIISQSSNWYLTGGAGGMVWWTINGFPTTNVNKRYYLGFRIFLEGDDFIQRPHYGCLEITLTLNEKVIVHGWSYQATPYARIFCNTEELNNTASVDDLYLHNKKEIVKITDITGREVEKKDNILLIYYYSDGSIEKVYTFNSLN